MAEAVLLVFFVLWIILIAIVIAIITDIDTPRAGLISLDERPLLELNETLRGSSASTTP